MQQHDIACHEYLLQEACVKNAEFLEVATTKNATTRNCNATGTCCTGRCHPLEIARVRLIRQNRRDIGKRGWSSEGSAQSHLTSCQKVALHQQLQMLSDFLGHEEEEEVRGRGRTG